MFFSLFFSPPLPPTHTPVHLSLLGQTLVYLVGLYGTPHPPHPFIQLTACCQYFWHISLFSVACPWKKRLVSNGKELTWLGVRLTVAVAHDKHLLQYSQMRTLLSKVFTAHFEPVHFTCGFIFLPFNY